MSIESLQLPESYFKSIEFTMQVGCGVGCSFCPQSIFVKNYKSDIKRFTLENFKRALNNIEGSPIKGIKFSGFSEPLEHSEIYDFIIEAYKKNFHVELITTLKNFSKEGFEKIKDLPIRCHVSIQPPNANNRKGLKDTDAWNNIELLLSLKPTCDLVFGCLDNNLTKENKNDIKKLADKLNITVKYEKYTTRAGYLGNSIIHKKQKLLCKHNMGPVALPNGDLALCCMDFGLRHIIGNIFDQRYIDILNSDKLLEILKIMLGRTQGDILCHTCEYAKPVPDFLSLRYYYNARHIFKNIRDSLIPKNSTIRNKLDKLFK
ncbi:MAG: radical SAM protein [Desulfurella sp.]